jgi:hypothetical protein
MKFILYKIIYIKMSIVSSVYFQNINRVEAENYVMYNDKLVFRRSYSVPGCFVLTFKHNSSPQHILLRENNNGTIDHLLSDNSQRVYRSFSAINILLTNYRNMF